MTEGAEVTKVCMNRSYTQLVVWQSTRLQENGNLTESTEKWLSGQKLVKCTMEASLNQSSRLVLERGVVFLCLL